MPNCPGAKLSGAKLSWCQIVRVPNCPLLLSWCQIVRFYYLGTKLSALSSWCQIVRCQIVRCQIVQCQIVTIPFAHKPPLNWRQNWIRSSVALSLSMTQDTPYQPVGMSAQTNTHESSEHKHKWLFTDKCPAFFFFWNSVNFLKQSLNEHPMKVMFISSAKVALFRKLRPV